ncbi:MAG: hypothetical protein M3O70_19560, partial [Actinomycetota bacterium]|nr:hypothetical protein [Actinomycetota bacterium]
SKIRSKSLRQVAPASSEASHRPWIRSLATGDEALVDAAGPVETRRTIGGTGWTLSYDLLIAMTVPVAA